MSELILITEELLRSGMADGELEALNNAGAESDDEGTEAPQVPLPERISSIIRQTCNKIAGYVNANPKNPRLPLNTNKVPAELEAAAIALARHALLADLPDMVDLEGSVRARAYSDAVRLLENVANDHFEIESFDDGQIGDLGIQYEGEPYQNFYKL